MLLGRATAKTESMMAIALSAMNIDPSEPVSTRQSQTISSSLRF